MLIKIGIITRIWRDDRLPERANWCCSMFIKKCRLARVRWVVFFQLWKPAGDSWHPFLPKSPKMATGERQLEVDASG